MASGEWKVGYEPESQELRVTFTNGKTYTFSSVPPDIAKSFQEAENKGEFYNKFIRGIF